MTWVRYDDRFTSAPVWDGVSTDARWHYLALVEACAATGRYTGVLPVTHAMRASDVGVPINCLRELDTAGLITFGADTVTVLSIADHVPPPGQRDQHLLPRKRRNTQAYRERQCAEGKHSRHCPPGCPRRAASRSETAGLPSGLPVTPGRDGTGRAATQDLSTALMEKESARGNESQETDDPWSSPGTCADCGFPLDSFGHDANCGRVAAS